MEAGRPGGWRLGWSGQDDNGAGWKGPKAGGAALWEGGGEEEKKEAERGAWWTGKRAGAGTVELDMPTAWLWVRLQGAGDLAWLLAWLHLHACRSIIYISSLPSSHTPASSLRLSPHAASASSLS